MVQGSPPPPIYEGSQNGSNGMASVARSHVMKMSSRGHGGDKGLGAWMPLGSMGWITEDAMGFVLILAS